MEPKPAAASTGAEPASLVVIDPHGHRTRVPIDPVPFRIGRQPESNLILRDSRASRTHARIVVEGGQYFLEDCGSRHGTHVNGKAISRHALRNSDKIEFGAQDSYQLLFALDGVELKRLMEQLGASEKSGPYRRRQQPGKAAGDSGPGANAASSFSVDDVLASWWIRR